jgi:hypothetical protein
VDVGTAVGLAVLGVFVAELVEALRLYTKGSGGRANRWPASLPFSGYVVASAIRLVLGATAAVALTALGLLCDEGLAFLAGLSTLKVIEILFGYAPAA